MARGSNDTVTLRFPSAGIDLSNAFFDQRPRQIDKDDNLWARSTPDAINVRAFEGTTNRGRGGSRAGLSRQVSTPVVADWIIQDLQTITTVGETPVQTSNSGRVVTLTAVSQGSIYRFRPGDTTWGTTTNNTGATPPLNYTGLVLSSPNVSKLWYADGVNRVVYDPSTNIVSTWAAAYGSLPADSDNNFPRLIETWRGRCVQSGLLKDGHGWFMSRVNDPTDNDYFPSTDRQGPDQAIAGENAPQGLIGDIVMGMCPYNDDVMIWFGSHSIYMMQGDPMANGQLDLITDTIGAVWGRPWCMDPYGNIFFLSNNMGVYVMRPGQREPQQISQPVQRLFQDINTGEMGFRLGWDDRFQGCHIFVTPLAEPGDSTSFFFEARTGAWWKTKFANTNHSPLCCCIFDGNLPADRALLIGSWDGYVRKFDQDAEDDDDTPIASSVVIGPLNTKDLDKIKLHELQGMLGEESGDVTYEILVGRTAEEALSSTAERTGTFQAGRNFTEPVQRSGYSVYVRLTSTNQWAMESVRIVLSTRGKIQQRGR